MRIFFVKSAHTKVVYNMCVLQWKEKKVYAYICSYKIGKFLKKFTKIKLKVYILIRAKYKKKGKISMWEDDLLFIICLELY